MKAVIFYTALLLTGCSGCNNGNQGSNNSTQQPEDNTRNDSARGQQPNTDNAKDTEAVPQKNDPASDKNPVTPALPVDSPVYTGEKGHLSDTAAENTPKQNTAPAGIRPSAAGSQVQYPGQKSGLSDTAAESSQRKKKQHNFRQQ